MKKRVPVWSSISFWFSHELNSEYRIEKCQHRFNSRWLIDTQPTSPSELWSREIVSLSESLTPVLSCPDREESTLPYHAVLECLEATKGFFFWRSKSQFQKWIGFESASVKSLWFLICAASLWNSSSCFSLLIFALFLILWLTMLSFQIFCPSKTSSFQWWIVYVRGRTARTPKDILMFWSPCFWGLEGKVKMIRVRFIDSQNRVGT